MSDFRQRWAAFRFYLAVAVPGGVLMALEIVSSRLLAPEFGSSVYVWGSIIGVFLAAMSIGYVLGGRWADQHPNLAGLGRLLLVAALAQGVVLLAGEKIVAWLGNLTGGAPWGTLPAIALLFGPTTILLATVAPYVVRLAAHDIDLLGDTAGRLYAVSTAGSLVGTLGATFVLIPSFDQITILRLLMLVTILIALAAIGEPWRPPHRASGVFAFALICLAFFGGHTATEDSVIARRMTPYQTIMIQQDGDIRYFRSNNFTHAGIHLSDGEPAILYPRFAAAGMLFLDDLDDFLTLGMGAGTVGPYLERRLPEIEVTYVEIDPAVPEMATQYMLFPESENERVVIDDGRRYLKSSDQQWDFIYCDTFIGSSIPFHMTTLEFFRLAKNRLKPGGIYGVHVSDPPGSPFGDAILKTLGIVFQQTYIFNIPGGVNLYVATDDRVTISREELMERGRALDQELDFSPSLEEMAGRLAPVDLDLTEAPILRDGFAPANYLIDERTHREMRALTFEEGLQEIAQEPEESEEPEASEELEP